MSGEPGIAELLAGGEHLGRIALRMLPDATRAAVRRCSIVPDFGELLYTGVLCEGGPALSDLTEFRLAQEVRGRAGWYRLEPLLREAAWQSWWTDENLPAGSPEIPAALAAEARRLVAYYQGAREPLEELRQLLLADPGSARKCFEELFEDSFAAFDMARCQDIVDVLASPDRAQLLLPSLALLRNERQRQVEARNQWARDYHQTGRYLSRPDLETELEALVDGTPSRVVQIHALPGMGKTMQLRWFAARYCLLRPDPVPCARIDFDLVDPLNAACHPWLTLLELADQLDAQIPESPFRELLRDYERYRVLLSVTPAPDTDLGDLHEVVPEQLVGRFVTALNESRGDAPVIVMLDTCEEAVLHAADGMRALVELLAEIHAQAPSVRLLLVGREDLTARPTGFAECFPRAVSVEIGPLSDPDAARYLQVIRGIDDNSLIEAVLHRYDGAPFTLAVFADLLEHDDSITAAEIGKSNDPALLYCITRILDRIPDDRICWAIRYGIVPRHLSFDVLRDVVRPYLVDGIDGISTVDDPDRDVRPRRRPLFTRRPGQAPRGENDLRELWQKLAHYASATSWVRPDGETLVFHPRIRDPLRGMLRPHEVWRRLNLDAARYFQRQAELDPARWSLWTRQVVYHRFQTGGEQGLETWREAIRTARRGGRPEWVRELADDLFSEDYGGATGASDGSVPKAALYEAHLEMARVLVDRAREARATADGALWSQVAGQLASAEVLLREPRSSLTRAPRHVLLSAALALARDGRAAARALLDRSWEALTAEEEQELALLRAEAATVARGLPRLPGAAAAGGAAPAADLASKIVAGMEARLENDLPEQALSWSRGPVRSVPPEALAPAMSAIRATAWVRLGRPGSALALLKSTGRVRSEAADWIQALALLALRRPAEAMAVLDPAVRAPSTTRGFTARLQLYCHCCEALLRVDDALAAVAPWTTLGLADAQFDRVSLALARLQMRAAGDLDQAAEHLRLAESFLEPSTGQPHVEVRLCRLEWLQRVGEHREAQQRLLELLDSVHEPSAQAQQRIRAALAGLAQGTPVALAAAFPALLDGLRRLPTVGSRLAMLVELRRCDSLAGVDETERQIFRELVVDPWERYREDTEFTEEDRAWRDLVEVEAYRLLDQEDLARARLDRAAGILSEEAPLIRWEQLQALDRMGPAGSDDHVYVDDLLDRYRATPEVGAAYLIDLAVRQRRSSPPHVTLGCLREAERLLGRAGSASAYRARLHDAWSDLAWSLGHAAWGEEHAARAAGIWDELGDRLARNRSLAAVRLRREPVLPERRPGPEAEITVSVQVRDEVEVAVTIGQPPTTERLPTPLWLAPLAVSAPVNEVLAEELSRSWARWRDRVWDLLLGHPNGERLLGSVRALETDVRLDDLAAAVAAAPWELILTRDDLPGAGSWIRHLYRSIGPASESYRVETLVLQQTLRRLGKLSGQVDGVYGPRTARSLAALRGMVVTDEAEFPTRRSWAELRRALQERFPQDQTHVLILQPDTYRSMRSNRGLKGSRADAEAVYRSHGVPVTSLDNPLVRDMIRPAPQDDLPEDWKPGIVHLTATMGAGPSGPYLDFYEGEAVTAPLLARLVRRLSGPVPPLVLLDVSAPATRHERIRQLLLRNRFAAELIAHRATFSVLATGLAEGVELQRQRDIIVGGFARRASAAEVAQRLVRERPVDEDSLETALAFQATALFSNVPPDALMGPGLLSPPGGELL